MVRPFVTCTLTISICIAAFIDFQIFAALVAFGGPFLGFWFHERSSKKKEEPQLVDASDEILSS